MPRLSIVIPCLGGAAEFDGTLVSVLQNRPADCEIIVVHTEAYDDPYELGDEVRFMQVKSRQLVELIGVAIEQATGEIVHLVGCGLEVREGWTEAALSHFADPEVAAVSPVVLSVDQKSVVAAGLHWTLGGTRRLVRDKRLLSPGTGRLRASILGPTLAAGFYRRDVLIAVGGFDGRAGDEWADIDLALTIQALGRLHVCEPAAKLIQVAECPISGASGGFCSGRTAERLFWQYSAPRGLIAALALHAWVIAAEIIRRLPSADIIAPLLGRTAALLDFSSRRGHERRLATAAERLAELREAQATVRLPLERQLRKSATPQQERRRAA